jgi:hypothetical protein
LAAAFPLTIDGIHHMWFRKSKSDRVAHLASSDERLSALLWSQLGAAIDMLDNAILACPEELWSDRSQNPEFWYVAYHTLFFLDLYASDSPDDFAPPSPFTLSELDPAGVLPERVYTKSELRAYLEYGRNKNKAAIAALTDASARRRSAFSWLDLNNAELVLYTLRHVQHHAAQLNLILRQRVDAAPGWVRRANDRAKDN